MRIRLYGEPYDYILGDRGTFEKAIEFFVRKKARGENISDLSISVLFKPSSAAEEPDDRAMTVMDAKKPKLFTVSFYGRMDPWNFYPTLAHECVHIGQWVRGDMVDPADSRKKYTFWKGRKFHYGKDTAQKDFPWEKEAYSSEAKLVEQFTEYMRKEDAQIRL